MEVGVAHLFFYMKRYLDEKCQIGCALVFSSVCIIVAYPPKWTAL